MKLEGLLKFVVVTGSSAEFISKYVDEAMDDGYSFHGNMSFSNGVFAQPMVLINRDIIHKRFANKNYCSYYPDYYPTGCMINDLDKV